MTEKINHFTRSQNQIPLVSYRPRKWGYRSSQEKQKKIWAGSID